MPTSQAGEPTGADTQDFPSLDALAARFFEDEPRAATTVAFGARTHPGKVRTNNEDNYLVVRRSRSREVVLSSLGGDDMPAAEQFAYTLAVADGMGGHRFGEIASLIALRSGWDLGGDEVKWTLKVNDREAEEMEQKGRVLFRLIHRAILDEAERDPRLRGMGTTLTVCYTTGPELFVIHAGDSRAYLLREGRLRRLTRDHNLAQEMIDAGEVEPDSAEARKVSHILTNSLGTRRRGVEVDVARHRLRDGDRLLLCTDGLSDLVDDDRMARTLDAHPDPDDACRALVDLALERGGDDNITAVVARYAFAADPTADALAAPGPPRG